MKKIVIPIASCLYIGYIPVFRGGFASLLSAFIYYFLPDDFMIKTVLTIFILLVGFFSATSAEKIFNKKDDPRIVIDEFSCFWIAMLMHKVTFWTLLIIFSFYRFFDILKPFYQRLQLLKGGIGILVDDVVSAILANTLFRVVDIFFF